jgi:probable sporulation protein (polysaccharide deacetylase family)
MSAMNHRKYWILISFSLLFVWALNQLEPINDYIDTLKYTMSDDYRSAYFAFADGDNAEDPDLLNQIKKEAAALYVKPINARIDPVWKAIPSYNGLSVDIDQTYYFARKLKGKIPFVYNEVLPKINLDQLEPQPIYKGNPRKPMVSIMINVAWGNEFIPVILKTLEEENVHSTFFLDGSWLEDNVDLAKSILEQGHELSNHAYSHKNMGDLSRSAAQEEIMKTQKLLKQLLGVDNRLFAPPSGHFDDETIKLTDELGLQTVLWTIDTVDWKKPEPSWIVQKISSRLEPGAMILMHPTSSSSLALPDMIKEIKNRGLTLGTVSELISPSRIVEVETKFNF